MRHPLFQVLLMLAAALGVGGGIFFVMRAIGAAPTIALFLSVVVGLLTLVLAFLVLRPGALNMGNREE
ncbi:MAG: hypothetical protein LPL00_07445 [Alphaproteobacteria bacterium]|nr:hypothetical protein [Alphaproteobacteria bacterium]MDX5369397.1 hypothetical protein [Alphaproteobacteria bacterium]MDX5464080.1 hypothetical protein [Alphaproteobacteria bacterium]